MFQDPHGRYADYLRNAQGQLVQMRVGDGVHYTPPAGDVLARAVLHRLNERSYVAGRLLQWKPNGDWRSWNVSRSHAERALREHHDELVQLAASPLR